MEKIWLKNYEPEVPHSMDYPDISLYELFLQSARQHGSQAAVSFMGRELTYNALLEQVQNFAAALQKLGVKKGDRVAIHLPNCTQFPIAYFATLSLGAVVVPCNPMYVARELAHQLKDSGAETIVTLTRFYKIIKEVQPQTNLKNVIVTSIKDFFPGFLSFLYTVAKEKKEAEPPAKAEPPKTLFISKSEIFLNKINKRSLKEFTDFTEFLKFNRMDPISENEFEDFNTDSFIQQLFLS